MATVQGISADEHGRASKEMKNDSQNVFAYTLA